MNQGKTIKFYGLICVAVAILVAFLGIGPMAPQAQAWEHTGPGWYGDIGYECYDVSYCRGELHAYVGLAVDWSARAHCTGGDWSMERVEIVTGALPPGLSISGIHIVGVPTRAGTWHLQVRFVEIECAGKYYGDETQTLAITTEGSSAPQSVY